MHAPEAPGRRQAGGRKAPPLGQSPGTARCARTDLAVASAVGVVALAVYLWTLAPAVLGDDSAEIVTAVHVLGIPHLTGYPLYLLLARLFSFLPLGSLAVRVGVFSAVCAAAAAGTIAWVTARVSASAPAGALAGLVAAFGAGMWSQATQPEVYALNALIVAAAVALFTSGEAGRPERLLPLAIVFGLGLAHHRSSVLITVPLMFAALWSSRPTPRVLLKLAAAAAAPLLCYLYLPIRAAARPPVMWAGTDTLRGLGRFLLGAPYRTYVFSHPPAEMVQKAFDLLRGAVIELTPGGAALAAVGLFSLLRQRRRLALPPVVGMGAVAIWSIGYAVEDWRLFAIPAALVAAIGAGYGIAVTARGLGAIVGPRSRTWGTALTAIALIFVPAGLIQHNWERSSQRGRWADYDRGRAMLAQVPDGSIWVSELDHGIFLPMYLQLVEGYRTDIVVTDSSRVYEPWTYDPAVSPVIAALLDVWPPPESPDPETRSRSALGFAAALGTRLEWSRPIYCLAFLPRPPRDSPTVAHWSDLFEVTPERPPLLAPLGESHMLASFDGGISLVGVAVPEGPLSPGDPLPVTLDWRCAQTIQEPPLVVLGLAHEQRPGRLVQPPRMFLQFASWLAYGVAPLAPTPPESVYRQEIVGAVPTNAPAGRWVVRAGLAAGYGEPLSMQQVAEFEVVPR